MIIESKNLEEYNGFKIGDIVSSIDERKKRLSEFKEIKKDEIISMRENYETNSTYVTAKLKRHGWISIDWLKK